MKYYSLIAAAPPSEGAQQNPMGSMWVMLILMFVIMYFLIIRPQSRQRKEQAARVASLEKGDRIITIGGLHGVVHQVGKSTVTIKQKTCGRWKCLFSKNKGVMDLLQDTH